MWVGILLSKSQWKSENQCKSYKFCFMLISHEVEPSSTNIFCCYNDVFYKLKEMLLHWKNILSLDAAGT